MINALKRDEIGERAIKIKDYVQNRYQIIKVEKYFFKKQKNYCGVLQGTYLRHLSLIVYIPNDVNYKYM